jgi:multidrug efflux system membrane fusion protein
MFSIHLKKYSPILLAVLGTVILIAGYAYFHTSKEKDIDNSTNITNKNAMKEKADRPIPVYASQVRQGDFPVWLNALGNVSARQQVVLRSRIDGELVALHFKEGQLVKKGQLLAEIDARGLQTQLAQQRAQLAKDKSLFHNAQRDLARYNDLAADEAIAVQQRDTQAALVQQYQATIDSDIAQINNTELQLSYTKITAPLHGKIGFRQVDVGNQIKASDSNGLATIVEIDPITVVFSLPENYLTVLLTNQKKASPLTIEAWQKDNLVRLATSQNWIMDNQVDATTGSIRLKAFFDNPEQHLTPNQFVNIKVNINTLKSALIIPTNALLHGAQGDYVYQIMPDNTVQAVTVKLLETHDDQLAISASLNSGDQLVTDGNDKLRPGSKVRIIPAQDKTSEAEQK